MLVKGDFLKSIQGLYGKSKRRWRVDGGHRISLRKYAYSLKLEVNSHLVEYDAHKDEKIKPQLNDMSVSNQFNFMLLWA